MTSPPTPSFDELVSLCAERYDAEGETALAALCAEHPDQAQALRKAMAPLIAFGLAGPGEPAAPPLGRLGEFELVREIGRGGMGVVYEARQPSLNRTVAVKVLPPAWVLDPRQITRFQNEARAAATFDHPHLVPVYVVGSEAGTHYYAMPLIGGVSIKRLLAVLRAPDTTDDTAAAEVALSLSGLVAAGAGGRGSAASGTVWVRRATELARQAASALDRAHALGILHRDIKPGNLLVEASGHLWVADFGLAHFLRDAAELTRSGEFVGTIAYSSPEQVGGRLAVDARSDVYSLGATLYEMLSLQPPFSPGDQAALVRQVVADEPRALTSVNPRVPRDLATIVSKAMVKEPTGRYQSAAAFAADLQAFLADRPISARATTVGQRAGRWCRRSPALATAIALASLLFLVAGVVGFAALRTATDRDRARVAETRLARLSSQRLIETKLEAAAGLRRSLAPGQRFDSLRLLGEAVTEIDAAVETLAERDALQRQLRSDVFASLGLWDVTPESLLGSDQPRPLALDANCSRCAVQRGEDLAVLDMRGQELARLPNPGRYPVADFDPSGEWLAVSTEQRLRLWHWPSGRVLEPTGPVRQRRTCWNKDGQELIAWVGERFVACDLVSGTWREPCAPAAAAHLAALASVVQVRASPDGKQLAACGPSAPLLILDLERDVAARAIKVPVFPHCALWEADGRHILVGGDLGIVRVNIASGVVAQTWEGHHGPVVRLTRAPNDQLLASRGWDEQIRLWDTRGRTVLAMRVPIAGTQLGFSADAEHLGWFSKAAGDGGWCGANRWRLHPPKVVQSVDLCDCSSALTPKVAFHPRLPLLAAAVREDLFFVHTGTGEILGEIPWQQPIEVRFLEDGRLFVASRTKAGLGVFSFEVDRLPEVHVGKPTLLAAGPVAEADVVGDTLYVWDRKVLRATTLAGREIVSWPCALPHGAGLSITPDGVYAAIGAFGEGSDRQASVWNLRTGAQVDAPAWYDSAAVEFSPDGRLLLVTRRSENWVLEVGTWRRVATIPRRATTSLAGSGAFTPDGTLLVVPTDFSRLQVIDTRTWKPVFEFDTPDSGPVNHLAFSPDGSKLAMASVHRRLFLWDLRAARVGLRELGLDWSDAPIPAAAPQPSLRLVFAR